ncbi:MAG TPA: exodeoxyribonuclease III [Pyrinomonadaceae bacterium]|jgi:exodeoxyribonuclease-3|nr:exodeoxyribonuclease III [Pyrinomonadaceae bacterium]
MKVATWNVNSVGARLPLVQKWLEAAGPDVLCLQETKCTDDKFPAAAFAEVGYRSEVYGQRTYNGVAILSRALASDVQRGFPDDEEGSHARLLAATVEGVRIVNVYVPNGQAVGTDKYRFKLEWMKRLRAFFDESYEESAQVLLCGDFNVAPGERDVHDPDLWQGRILFSKRERAALDEIKGWGLTDAFRMHTEEGGHFSWWDYRQGSFRRNTGLRIDHIWVSTTLAARCTAAWIDKEPRGWERPSDHTPVVAEFK